MKYAIMWMLAMAMSMAACKKDNENNPDDEPADLENFWAYAEFSDGVIWNSLGGGHHVNAKGTVNNTVLTIIAERNKRKITLELHGFNRTQDVAFGKYVMGVEDDELLALTGAKKAVLTIDDNGTSYRARTGEATINSFAEDNNTKQGITVSAVIAEARSADGKTLHLTNSDGGAFGNYVTVRVSRN
jgi:hypothetical protein